MKGYLRFIVITKFFNIFPNFISVLKHCACFKDYVPSMGTGNCDKNFNLSVEKYKMIRNGILTGGNHFVTFLCCKGLKMTIYR